MRIKNDSFWVLRRSMIGAALCLFVILSGCVQITPTPEPAAITFACTEEEEAYFGPVREAFNKEYRHIAVEFVRPQRFSWPDMDVFDVSPFTRRFMDQEEAVATLDLSPYIGQDEAFEQADFYPGLIDMFRIEETEIWAIPYMVDVGVMYYNRDLFDEYGVAYPQLDWTWDDFLRTAQTFYAPVIGIFGYIPDEQKNDPLAFVYQNGGRIFDDFQNPTRTTFDDVYTIEALDWYAKLMYEYEAAATPQQARQAYSLTGSTQTGIREGRLGMWSGTLSDRGGRLDDEEWGINWGIVPLPKGKQSATFAFTNGYVISTSAQDPDACWAWISFLTHQVPPYGMPARKSVAESKGFEDMVGKDVAAVARASVEHALFFSPAGWDIYGTFQIFNEALEKLYSGKMTAQQVMEWAQQQSQYK
ncbi:MAG: extracellular solute-binding protein [Anaerolineae bacterium]|nr:extracellular solute-binding protein [Anaerolineae bacterium]